MRLGRALSDHYAGISRGQPNTFAGLVDALGGTRKAAEAITAARRENNPDAKGVSQREVQRLRAHETGSAKQTRGAKTFEAAKAQLAEAAEQKDWDKARADAKRDGIHATVDGEMLYSDTRGTEPRSIDATITDPEAIDELFDALEAHDYREAATAFDGAFFDAYDLPGAVWASVDSLTIS